MNNVAYVRALMGLFTVAELKAMDPREAEVVFLSPCFERETLAFRARQKDSATEFAAFRPDGVGQFLYGTVFYDGHSVPLRVLEDLLPRGRPRIHRYDQQTHFAFLHVDTAGIGPGYQLARLFGEA